MGGLARAAGLLVCCPLRKEGGRQEVGKESARSGAFKGSGRRRKANREQSKGKWEACSEPMMMGSEADCAGWWSHRPRTRKACGCAVTFQGCKLTNAPLEGFRDWNENVFDASIQKRSRQSSTIPTYSSEYRQQGSPHTANNTTPCFISSCSLVVYVRLQSSDYTVPQRFIQDNPRE